MSLFLVSTLIFTISVAAMAIGAAFGRPPLGMGCGSVNGCDGCDRPCERRARQADR